MQDLIINLTEKTITVPHLGFTLRTLFGAVSVKAWEYIDNLPLESQKTQSNWRPKLRIIYKDTVIGEMRMKSLQQFKRDVELGKVPTNEACES
jgi:hypothetical protein